MAMTVYIWFGEISMGILEVMRQAFFHGGVISRPLVLLGHKSLSLSQISKGGLGRYEMKAFFFRMGQCYGSHLPMSYLSRAVGFDSFRFTPRRRQHCCPFYFGGTRTK